MVCGIIQCQIIKDDSWSPDPCLSSQVDGDDTLALQSVLECDEERERLLGKEKELTNKSQASPTRWSWLYY